MSKVELGPNLNLNNIDKHDKVKTWIESLGQEDGYSVVDLDDLESMPESSVVESSDSEFDSYEDDESTLTHGGVKTTELGTKIATNEISTITESLKDLFNSINSVQTVGNVKIENSTGVHIGNITNINGNIQIIHAGHQRKHKNNNKAQSEEEVPPERPPRSKTRPSRKVPVKEEREERVRQDAFIDKIKVKLPQLSYDVIPRCTWLAQKPLEDYDFLEEPVEYVIISHTATESSERQAINIRTIRDIQCFHIESREWNDIAYNFLVGCDGNIYEGRGWGVVGAHTKGYNSCALGFSFIGCFMRELPTQSAMKACKELLKRGVKDGHIAANYKLLCHCQISATESPGRRLYEEIQKWENFYNPEE